MQKLTSITPSASRSGTLVGVIALLAAATAQAAFVALPSPTPETPGVSLGAATAGLSGTVVAFRDSPFIDNALPTPFATGTLRSIVVDRGGGLLDFYYQLVNTSPEPSDDPDKEFYRMKTTGGFSATVNPSVEPLTVAQTTSLSGLNDSSGTGIAFGSYLQGGTLGLAVTADRDVGTLGSVGFDFSAPPAFTGSSDNIEVLETSAFLVIRTGSRVYGDITMAISGAATSFASSFSATPIPEPGSVFAGFGILGLIVAGRRFGAGSCKSRAADKNDQY